MEILKRVLTASEIRSMGLKDSDTMSYDYLYAGGQDCHYLVINGQNRVIFSNTKERERTYNKIKDMGFCRGWVKPLPTDEEEGIVEAAKRGENPFAYSIMCANPKYNEVVK